MGKSGGKGADSLLGEERVPCTIKAGRVRYDISDGGDEAVANNGEGGGRQEHGGTK